MRFLLIEDQKDVRNLMQAFLSGLGSCEMAEDGIRGLSLFQQSLSENRPYDAIFLDIMMPKLEGQEVAHFMLFGRMFLGFVILENLIGKVIPLVIVMVPKFRENNYLLILAAIMNMIGILAMRIVTVYGGQVLPLM